MGPLDAIKDEQFRSDVGRGLLDVGNRGVAGILGGPVDLAALALKPLGYSNPAPIGGSEWIGGLMEKAGMVTPQRRPVAEFLASLATPAVGVGGAKMLGLLSEMSPGIAASPGRMGPLSKDFQIGAISPEGKARMLADLQAGKGSGTYRLGDVTEGQSKGLQRLGIPETAGRDVMMTDDAFKHLMDRRMALDQFSPEEIVRFAEQAMRPRAKAWIDPAGRAHKPSLQNGGLLDPVSGRRYDAQMPLAAKDAGLEVVTVIPRGLPGRKTKAPE